MEARGILAVNDRAAVAANKVDQAARAARVVVSRAVAVGRVDREAGKRAAPAGVRVAQAAGKRVAPAVVKVVQGEARGGRAEEEVSKAGREARNGSAL